MEEVKKLEKIYYLIISKETDAKVYVYRLPNYLESGVNLTIIL